MLAFITLYGLSFSLWGTIGLIRLFSQNNSRAPASPIRLFLLFSLGALIAFLLFNGLHSISTAFRGFLLTDTLPAEDINLLPAAISWVRPAVAWTAASILVAYTLVRILRTPLSMGDAFLFPVLLWSIYYYFEYSKLDSSADLTDPADLQELAIFFSLALVGSWFGGRHLVLLSGLADSWNQRNTINSMLAEKSHVELNDVAVLVPAHNEEKTIHLCLDALQRVVPMRNVFVGSDGSTDNTVEAVKQWDCNVADIQPNGGKARAIQYLIDHYELCDRYKAVLIMDADSEIDEAYMKNALPLFDDPSVVAIAGHAVPKWKPHWIPVWGNFFIAYRVRLYKVMQAFLRYGQTWEFSNVSYIIPGFSSMYRCSVIPYIDITAPGLLIEDFNMTFEIHKKRCGKIGYTPRAVSVCEDPHSLRDYFSQVKRWNLGFWQTVKRHGFWFSFFWLALGTFTLEVLLQSAVFLMFPIVLVWLLITPGETIAFWLPTLGFINVSLSDVVIGIFLVDYMLTVVIAMLDRKPMLLLYGLGFVLLRWIDAFIFLYTLPLAYFIESDGRWSSPSRA